VTCHLQNGKSVNSQNDVQYFKDHVPKKVTSWS